MAWRIYHNPKCGTSRKVLGLLQDAGVDPEVVFYLKTPPSRAELTDLVGRLDGGVRALLRRRGTPYDELGLDAPDLSDEALIDAILEHPILMERPLVVAGERVVLCRPLERAEALLAETG